MVNTIEKLEQVKLDPLKVNGLTELSQTGYKLYSIILTDLYNGLHPASLSKLSHIIFNGIFSNKMYRKPEAKGYNEDEAKRIFTNTLIQPSDLAKRINPVKYSDGKTDIENDISNIIKRLDELEEYNVFYIWKFKPVYASFSYIYIMERDVSSWKYYNQNGCIYPKSVKKILRLTKSLIETMESLEKQRGRKAERIELEKSFGEFVNGLIKKMHCSVSENLTKWTEGTNIFSYITTIQGELRKLNEFEGCSYDKSFIVRLPEHIRNKIMKVNKEMINTMNTNSILESELVPLNDNLVKTKSKSKRTKTKEIEQEKTPNVPPIKAELMDQKIGEPFKNPTELTKYYRSYLRTYNNNIKFFDFSSEVSLAGEVLDTLTKNGRFENIRFLKAWMRFYYVNHLKGNNIFKDEMTSIKAFLKTFEAYNKIYIG